ISHRWDTVGPPNGGFLLALAARGLTAAAPFPDPVTLTGHFLRPSRHTPVEIHVTPIRTGSTHATLMAGLHQGGKELLRAPAVFDMGVSAGAIAAWVPTVELTVHVRGRPGPGWIAASFRTKFLCDGYFEEDGELWDSTGRLVALSRQLAVTRGRRPE